MAATTSTENTPTQNCAATENLLKALHDDVIPLLSAALLAVGVGNSLDAETHLKKAGAQLQTVMLDAALRATHCPTA
jgi:hypothetical protein